MGRRADQARHICRRDELADDPARWPVEYLWGLELAGEWDPLIAGLSAKTGLELWTVKAHSIIARFAEERPDGLRISFVLDRLIAEGHAEQTALALQPRLTVKGRAMLARSQRS